MSALKNWRTLFTVVALLGLVFSLPAPVNAQASTPQAAGDPHMVSGVVTDGTPGGHAWPLYARIDIAGFSGSPVFTNPVSGAYSVTLEEGAAYELTISAVQGGYQPLIQNVTVPAGDLTVDFGLQVEEISCEAPGYALVDHWTENFDSVTAPDLPANWASQTVSGSPTPWVTRNNVNVPPYTYPVHSGPNAAYFRTSSGFARLTSTAPVNLTALENQNFTFWMFQNGGYPNDPASVQVKVSTNSGQSWVAVGPVFNYYGSTTGWVKNVVDLSAYADQTGLLFGFESGTSGNMGYIHIDSVSLGATCDPVAGALLTGRVLDANTGLAVTGAKVQSGLDETFSQTTPLDAALEDGFYSVFAPAGASVAVTASKIPYQPLPQMLTLTAETVATWTFLLPAGRLAATPDPASLTLPMNATGDLTLSLGNTGGASADFKLTELNRPVNGTPSLVPVPGPNAGEVLSSFSTGLQQIWGLAYNPLAGDLWIQDLQSLDFNVEDNRLVRFGVDGVNSGDQIVSTSEMNASSDLTFNPLTGTLWQTGKNSCIYELDLLSRQATGNTICLPGNGPETLAFDPFTNTYLASRTDFNSPSTSFIYRFTPQGEILASGKVGLRIMAMTYNPATGHLFSVTGSYTIYVIDAATFGQIGFLFSPYDPYNYLHGIDMDCNGSLWATDVAYAQKVYEIDSGESGVCDWMKIPWLNAASTTGSVPAHSTQSVTLTFDSAGMMPGTYTAQLDVAHNTPYAVPRLPVTMTVTLAAGYGGISGTLTALERCGGTPAVLPGAQVEILAGDTVIYTGHTDAGGQYTWASAAAGNYTLRASAAGYVTKNESFTLTADQMLTKDLALSSDAPCITSSASSLNATITGSSTATVEFTLTNNGAGSGEFELNELPAGGIAAPLMPLESLLNEGFETPAFPPAGWQASSAADPATSRWFTQNYVLHSGELAAHVPLPGSNNPLDEWLLTPEYQLHSGNLSFWSEYSGYCKGTPDTCDLNIWLVVGAVGGTDDVFVGRADDAWTASNAWAQSVFDLTPLLPNGPVRIGFQFSRAADYSGVTLDDVQLEGAVGVEVPWLSETPMGDVIAPDGSQTILVSFDPAGLENGVYEAVLRVRLTPYESIDLPVTLTFSNNAPILANQVLATAEDTPISGSLSATDADGDSLTYSQSTAPAHGTVTINADTGGFTYTPEADFYGDDSFAAIVTDGIATDIGTVTIIVTEVNDVPVANDQTLSTDEDSALTGTLTASDVDSTVLTYAQGSAPTHGTLTIDPSTGDFTYTPSADYHGPDSFTFIVSDDSLQDVGSISMTVNSINDFPVANDQALSTNEDFVLTGTLTASDVDSAVLTYAQASDPAHGTLVIDPSTGNFTYTPVADYHGADSFTFTVSDSSLLDTGLISITVTPVNDAPVAPEIADVDWKVRVAGDYEIPAFTDVDGDVLSYTATLQDGAELPAWLKFDDVTLTFSGTPADRDVDVYLLKVVADDRNGGLTEARFTLTVTANGARVFLPVIIR